MLVPRSTAIFVQDVHGQADPSLHVTSRQRSTLRLAEWPKTLTSALTSGFDEVDTNLTLPVRVRAPSEPTVTLGFLRLMSPPLHVAAWVVGRTLMAKARKQSSIDDIGEHIVLVLVLVFGCRQLFATGLL